MKPSKLGRGVLGPQKDFELAMASRRAALSGNTSLIATVSSCYLVFTRT